MMKATKTGKATMPTPTISTAWATASSKGRRSIIMGSVIDGSAARGQEFVRLRCKPCGATAERAWLGRWWCPRGGWRVSDSGGASVLDFLLDEAELEHSEQNDDA